MHYIHCPQHRGGGSLLLKGKLTNSSSIYFHPYTVLPQAFLSPTLFTPFYSPISNFFTSSLHLLCFPSLSNTLHSCPIRSLNPPFLLHTFHMPDPFENISLHSFQHPQFTLLPPSFWRVSCSVHSPSTKYVSETHRLKNLNFSPLLCTLIITV